MTIQLHEEESSKGVYIECTGIVTGEELMDLTDKLSKRHDCTYYLYDFVNASKIDVSPFEMHAIAKNEKFIDQSSKLNKVAIVGEPMKFNHLYRAYHNFGKWVGREKPFLSETFFCMDDARNWVSA